MAAYNQLYSEARIVVAIRLAEGCVQRAARILKCDRGTIYKRAIHCLEIRKAVLDARALRRSRIEEWIEDRLEAGDLGAAKRTLSMWGAKYGYQQRAGLSPSRVFSKEQLFELGSRFCEQLACRSVESDSRQEVQPVQKRKEIAVEKCAQNSVFSVLKMWNVMCSIGKRLWGEKSPPMNGMNAEIGRDFHNSHR